MKHSLKKLTAGILAVASLTLSSQVLANNPAPTIKADAPNRYIVKKGDTLWGISGKYLNKPWQWKEIWATNKQIKNPHLIYPNDVIILCVIQGQQLIGIDTGEGCAGLEKTEVAPEATLSPTEPQKNSENNVVENVAGSIPAISLTAIEAWLDRTVIVNPEDFNDTPYVFASKNKNIITGAGNIVYTNGRPLIVNKRYGVYRKGKPYIDPMSKKVIGLEVTQVASGDAINVASNGVSSIELKKSFGQEVREGDRVFLEVGNHLPPVFYPKPAKANRGGRVIRVLNSISSAGRDGVVAINLGSRQNVSAGDVLTVFKKGALVQDNFAQVKGGGVRLPSEEIGHVMVFKTFDDISYAYVLDAELPISEADYLTNPN
ncbi:peptidoglycan-binding LysM [Moraxella macacae 0408225]|uniref:Peptidoglycan-binding LysM n=1 Tax=Moraxella macacae 0408225 TaxID=1230338 RepID=L2F8E1_9GAMM|nr:LysM peptidoglycan-binding domain-containing protein [Moraxella macacae]ELA09155.1 peptidoglycan-binding LysM [Moraxella macacae 0408225]